MYYNSVVGTPLGQPFVMGHALPNGKFAWEVRNLNQVKDVYEVIYGKDEPLVTGMDVIFFQPQKSPSSARTPYSMHVDQNKYDPIRY